MTRTVGLDIGTSAVRAVELRRHRGEYLVHRMAEIDLPEGTVRAGTVVDTAALAKALRRLWRKGRFGSRKVIVGISDAAVITRRTELPWMPAEDFSAALRYQVADALPIDLSQVELDYQALGEFSVTEPSGHSTDMLDVLLVAANSELVTGICRALLEARLEPVHTDTSAFALIRSACGGRLRRAGDGLEALVDVGADVLTVIVHQGGQPRFIRAIPGQGGQAAVRALSDQLQLSLKEAAELLVETGLTGAPPVVTPIAGSGVFGMLADQGIVVDQRASTALEIIGPWATALIGSIRDSLDYFNAGGGGTIDRIRLTGRTAALRGFSDRVATELRLPVSEINPFDGVKPPKKSAAADPGQFTIATGLAMAAA